jgi:hypothetical protein
MTKKLEVKLYRRDLTQTAFPRQQQQQQQQQQQLLEQQQQQQQQQQVSTGATTLYK